MKYKINMLYKVLCTFIILMSIVSCANINLNGIYINVNEASEKILQTKENIDNLTVYVRNTDELNTLCNALRLRNKNIKIGLDLSYSDFNYIGEAFIDCDSLVSVKLPNRLTAIDTNSFKGCDNLSRIDIPENVKIIKPYAFFECKNLENVFFDGTSCSSIEYGSFMECPKLSNFIIPSSIKKIGVNAFSYSPKVNFTVQGTNEWKYGKENNSKSISLENFDSYSWGDELTR